MMASVQEFERISESSTKKLSSNISLLSDNEQPREKRETKLLGVYIHENVCWKSHETFICNKMAKPVGMIYRLRYLLCILSLNFPSIIPSYYPYLSYCNIVWSFTHNSHLNRIYLLQKHAIRALTNSKYRAHFAPLFARLTILDSLVTVFLRSMSLNLCSAITIISYFLLF